MPAAETGLDELLDQGVALQAAALRVTTGHEPVDLGTDDEEQAA